MRKLQYEAITRVLDFLDAQPFLFSIHRQAAFSNIRGDGSLYLANTSDSSQVPLCADSLLG